MSFKCIKSIHVSVNRLWYLATHLIWYFEWYFDQFSGPRLGNLGSEMIFLYGKIDINIKNFGNCLLNLNFPSINFRRYMHCVQHKERWSFTHLWVFSQGIWVPNYWLKYNWVPNYNWLNHQNLLKLAAEFEFSVTKLL